MSDNLKTNPKLFADDTSLFSIYHDLNVSANDLNHDWAYQWKMNFNPDPSKQAQEIIFSRKIQENFHPPLYFNNIKVEQTALQKHLGMFLDAKLDFKEHLKNMSVKVNKSTALLRKLQSILPSHALVTI